MKYFSPVLLTSGLLTATAWIPTSESFRSVSFSSGHKIGSDDFQPSTIKVKSNINKNNRKTLPLAMVKSNSDDMLTAQETEARKICPLLPPPEDVHATFEAAMG